MRIAAKYITSALVSCAVALGIAVAPAASADPGPVHPASVATAPSAVGGDVVQAGYGHYGYHGANGYYAGRGWYPAYGWHGWPWGWYR